VPRTVHGGWRPKARCETVLVPAHRGRGGAES
jgi:hypothetical protein